MSSTSTKGTTLLREFVIQTNAHTKTLSIYKGDILDDPSDVIAINVYDQEGELFENFKFQNNAPYTPERKILSTGTGSWTGISSSMDSDKHVIYVHTDKKEGNVFSYDDLRSMIKVTFATLSIFIYEGNKIRTVAVPVLFRKGIKRENYQDYIHLSLYEATQYLKNQTSMESLHIYIWHDEDAAIWEHVLAETLITPTGKEVSDDQIQRIKRNIAFELQEVAFMGILPDWLRKSLKKDLTSKNSNLSRIASNADKMIHILTDQICSLPMVPENLKTLRPLERLLSLKSERVIVEWLIDYMLSIKTFNRFVRTGTPSKIDEYQYLLQLFQTLSYCRLILLPEGKNTDEEK
jgi:hypothetical protein